ncbi:MAG: hypothetical protein ACREO3_11815 [Arenimonas sp.]
MRASCLVAVGVLAAVSLPLTALPARAALAGGLACATWTAWRAWRDLGAEAGTLVLDADGLGATWTSARETVRIADLTVRWRGSIASVGGRDPAGKLRHLAWWPDTLPAPARRALRLAAGRPVPPHASQLIT